MLLRTLNMAHPSSWLPPSCMQHDNGLLLEGQEQDACCWLSTRKSQQTSRERC